MDCVWSRPLALIRLEKVWVSVTHTRPLSCAGLVELTKFPVAPALVGYT